MEIAVLIDNTAARKGLASEWGLACCLRLDNGHLWLWDAGDSSLFLDNARAMGVDPAEATGLGISHGHYDHTGGVPALLGHTDFQGPVFAHPDHGLDRYSLKPGKPPKPIGLPEPLPGVRPIRSTAVLDDALCMVADIPRLDGFGERTRGFFLDPEGTRPDPVRDDACLVIRTDQGPVVLLGCCHAGLANTLEQVRKDLGYERILAVAGGLHLTDDEEEPCLEAAEALKRAGSPAVYAGHCTCPGAVARLKELLPGRVHGLGSGAVLKF